MNRSMQGFAGALLAASAVLIGPAAHAQRNAPPSGTSGATAAISDEKLDAAANAIVRVNTVSQQFEQRFAAAPPEERGRIADEADVALVQAVQDSGLSVEEYNTIVQTAQADPNTKARLLQRIPAAPKNQ